VLAGDWSRPLRALFRFASGPVVAVVLFNIAMIAWHNPRAVRPGGEQLSGAHLARARTFFAAGVLFWLQFIPSPALRSDAVPGGVAALLATNVVMIFIAMTLSIFATHSIYPLYDHRARRDPPHSPTSRSARRSVVCGDFWALPR